MSDKRTNNVVLTIAVLCLVPLLYMGSYFTLLTRNGPTSLTKVGSRYYYLPNFKVGGAAAQTFYWPAYLLDRAVRPLNWRVDLRDPSAVLKEMWIPAIGW